MDTGQLLTYLYLLLLPVIVLNLIRLTYPAKFVAKVITKLAPWCLRGRPCAICRTRVKRYKIPEQKLQNKGKNLRGATMRTYLFPALFTAFKIGCRVESFLQQFSGPLRSHLAFQSKQTPTILPVRFDSDSFLIGVDSHASRCMVNNTHLFEDLCLNENNEQVSGIADGLAIEGEGTFKFDVTDDNGKRHTIKIKIKNSLYVPKMRRCLLLPQHWAQEAKNGETWMEFKREFPYDCVLNWKGGKKTIPNQPLTNVPVFYTASSSLRYCAFATTFEAMEASFF